MIADSTRNRIVTRVFIAIVAAVSHVSFVFSLYILLFHQNILISWKDPRFILFGWCLAESIFWIWSVVNYKYQSPIFDRVIPSLEERQKIKADCLWIIDSSPNGVIQFLEGWFMTKKRKARIEDLQQGNIKDW